MRPTDPRAATDVAKKTMVTQAWVQVVGKTVTERLSALYGRTFIYQQAGPYSGGGLIGIIFNESSVRIGRPSSARGSMQEDGFLSLMASLKTGYPTRRSLCRLPCWGCLNCQGAESDHLRAVSWIDAESTLKGARPKHLRARKRLPSPLARSKGRNAAFRGANGDDGECWETV
jgi:hypothetical protein